MRKVYTLLIVVLLGFVLNFTLWFLHTRTLNESLVVLKKELGMQGIIFTFDDIRYTNFRSWKVKGALFNPKIVKGGDPKTEIMLSKIDIISKPFDSKAVFIAKGDIFIKRTENEVVKEYRAIFDDKPVLEIELDTSLDSLNEAIMEADDEKNIFSHIDSIEYKDSGFTVFDRHENTKYMDIEKTEISLEADSDDEHKEVDLKVDFQGLQYESGYQDIALKGGAEKQSTLGKASLFLDISFQERPSDRQKDFVIAQAKQKKADDVKLVMDSVKVDIKSFKLKTSKFKFSLEGDIDKQPNTVIPYMDLNLTINDYSNFIDYYAGTLNISIADMKKKQPLMPIKSISQQQVAGVKKLIKGFAGDSDDVTLKFYNEKDKPFTISDRPFKEVFEEVQAIIFSNIGFSDRHPQYRSLRQLKQQARPQ